MNVIEVHGSVVKFRFEGLGFGDVAHCAIPGKDARVKLRAQIYRTSKKYGMTFAVGPLSPGWVRVWRVA